MDDKIKKEVRIVGGATKIVETKNGKIIRVVEDYKEYIKREKEPISIIKNDRDEKRTNYLPISRVYIDTTFTDIANRFYNNIKEFVSVHGKEYHKYDNIHDEFDKDYPENRKMPYTEYRKLFSDYKKEILENLPSKKLRKIICDYIIEKFHFTCSIYNIKIQYFTNEQPDMNLWFEEKCGYFFDLGIISRHNNGIDYLCEYEFDPLITSLILKDEKVLEFFYKFVDPKDAHKECGTKHLQIELEYKSGNFTSHGHSIGCTDMIICFENNKYMNIPVLELCQWSERPVKREIDEYIDALDFHLATVFSLLRCDIENLRFDDIKESCMERLMIHAYDYLKYIESYRSRDNDKQEIKNFLVSDHRLKIILETVASQNIIKKEYIDEIIDKGIIDKEFFIDKDSLLRLIDNDKTIYK